MMAASSTGKPTPANWSSSLFFLSVFCLIAAWVHPWSAIRSRPGGPFVSIHANVIPAALALAAIGFALIWFLSAKWAGKLVAIAMMLLAGLVIRAVVGDVLGFAYFPHARGRWIGW
jgi:hypothetical protein